MFMLNQQNDVAHIEYLKVNNYPEQRHIASSFHTRYFSSAFILATDTIFPANIESKAGS